MIAFSVMMCVVFDLFLDGRGFRIVRLDDDRTVKSNDA